MSESNTMHSLSRGLLALATLLLGVGVLERLINMAGYTLLQPYLTGGRLLEISAVAILFTIALLLHQIRDELRGRGGD